MNEFEVIKHMMLQGEVGYDELSSRLGYASRSTSHHVLHRKRIYFDTWRRCVEALGYEVVVKKRGGRDSYVVSDDILPSPLRFTDFDLNLDRILSKNSPKKQKGDN